MPSTTAITTEQKPTSKLIRMPNMIADSTSRPLRVGAQHVRPIGIRRRPGRFEAVEQRQAGQIGGIVRRDPRREHRGADQQQRDRADAIATGEPRKPCTKSLAEIPHAGGRAAHQ